jgi:D-alanine-D-alanine ligase
LKVVVLSGGSSLERQVSLRSGSRVQDALESGGHQVVAIDPGPDLVASLRAEQPDAVFIALHGTNGEDGTIQELLSILGLPYTGPGVASCRRSIDKVAAKLAMSAAGIATPDWVSFSSAAFSQLGAGDALEEIERRLGFPLVVKPVRGGSAMGVRFAAGRDDVPGALVAALSYDDRVLLERHVDGRELAVGVLGGEALPAVEIKPNDDDRYSYEARYEIGRTSYEIPAALGSGEADSVRDAALRTWEALGCEGFARVDLILDGDGTPQVLEVNAIPGLTDTSLFPMAAEAAGIGFEELCGRIVELARRR